MDEDIPHKQQPPQYQSTMIYVFGIFLVMIILLVCANTTTRRSMMQFLHIIGIPVKRSPRVIRELKRKGFHFSGLIIPFIYLVGLQTQLMNRFSGSLIMIVVSTGYFIMECARLFSPTINKLFAEKFGGLLREKERHNFTGSFFYLIGSTVCIVFFSPPIAVSAILFLIIGDFMAALVGISYGRIKIGKKSLEGSVACFVSCFLICFLMFWHVKLGEQLAFWGALAATVTELLNPPFIDDNLSIPCISALAIHLIAIRLNIEIPQSVSQI
jgi:diacylglycerol kinase (CTP)